jgi:nicotinamidase-related amidase
MANNGDSNHHHAFIGTEQNFWRYSSKTGFDLTRSSNRSSSGTTIQTTSKPITINPAKSALVIIDMQNYFLSPAFGRKKGAGHAALNQLVQYAVPAARKAGIRIIWLNWGMTDKEIEEMPPAVTRAFGFDVVSDGDGDSFDAKGRGDAVNKHGDLTYQGGDAVLEDGKHGRKYKGLGSECGLVEDPETGKEIDAGRLLMRDAWNSALCPPLDKLYKEGKELDVRPDVWIHKNRMSGMWGAKTECEEFLEKEGIKTLLFTGVNTDQCVGGTFTDSFSKGYDCILLNDGAATTSPNYAQQCFGTSCKAFADGVDASLQQ